MNHLDRRRFLNITFITATAVVCAALFLAGLSQQPIRAAAVAAPLRICLLSGSAEYKSDESLAGFQKFLEAKFNAVCHRAFGKDKGTGLPGLEALETSDVMVVFTRRVNLTEQELAEVKKHLAAGKPIVGIRTASHAFQNFMELDAEVFGGSYKGHYTDRLAPIRIVPGMAGHPILAGVPSFSTLGKLYKNAALAEDVTVLLTASTEEHSEPVAWTRRHNGGRMFYTSLGVPEDFEKPEFRQMLVNALFWTAGRKPEAKP
jgi:type 1 glutamine amidotransferase